MAFDFSHTLETVITQCPLAGVALYAAKVYMEKHESAIQKLVSTFEAEVKACEARYSQVFEELMNLKAKIK